MEKLYSFLGKKYSLDKVTEEVDNVLQNMANEYADMLSLYKSLMNEIKVKETNEKNPELAKFEELDKLIHEQGEDSLNELNEKIANKDYEGVLEGIEFSVRRFDRVMHGMEKTLDDVTDSKADDAVRYATLKQNRDLIRFALKEIKAQQEYNQAHFAENEEAFAIE